MDTLNKTIKKLNESEYQELLSAVAGRKNNKPYVVFKTEAPAEEPPARKVSGGAG